EAKVLLPKAVFLPAEIEASRSALRQLALDFQCFSPLVGLEEDSQPESLYSDVTGCTHLWGGEERFVEDVRGYWRSRGYHAQIALACSLGAAWALSRTTAARVVRAGEEVLAFSGLPVAALRLPSITLERLHVLGLATIGEVMQLPRETLVSRFGIILPQRLDQ